jgi:CheY-like chemotaxis protein
MREALRILIVEDEIVASMLLETQLRKNGYGDIRLAASGEEAVVAAKEGNPDVIIMDIGLPGRLDGIEAARIIKSQSDALVVFVTGYEDPETRERAAEIAPLGYFEKPLRFEKLRALIEGGLGDRRASL